MEKEFIRERICGCKPCRIEDERFMPAAVLMPIFVKDGKWHVLLTLRSADLPTHKGQIAFPGGHVDDGESTRDAALREAHEEVGIDPAHVDLLGCLDDIITITKYRITPFVGIIPYPYTFTPSENEIAEIIEMPLETLCDHAIFHREDKWQFEGKAYPVYFFGGGRHTVWGATARILKQFLEVVMDWREPE